MRSGSGSVQLSRRSLLADRGGGVVGRWRGRELAWVLDYWPSVILVPTILLVIAVLVLVTYRWDRRDKSVRARQRVVLGQQRLPRQSDT
jgi:hypothetical protein